MLLFVIIHKQNIVAPFLLLLLVHESLHLVLPDLLLLLPPVFLFFLLLSHHCVLVVTTAPHTPFLNVLFVLHKPPRLQGLIAHCLKVILQLLDFLDVPSEDGLVYLELLIFFLELLAELAPFSAAIVYAEVAGLRLLPDVQVGIPALVLVNPLQNSRIYKHLELQEILDHLNCAQARQLHTKININ